MGSTLAFVLCSDQALSHALDSLALIKRTEIYLPRFDCKAMPVKGKLETTRALIYCLSIIVISDIKKSVIAEKYLIKYVSSLDNIYSNI